MIYLRVGLRDVYRLELTTGSSLLQDPSVHLINRVRGSPWICSPLDFNLGVSDNFGTFRGGLIVKSMTKLTPDEVNAIPPRYRP